MKNYTIRYDTLYQLKMPLEISQIIEIFDPVYTFNEVVSSIDLRKYFAEKDSRMGRPRCDAYKMLKIILFAFMGGGYESLRQLEKLCKTDIRYIWILDGMKAPSFATFGSFIREELTEKIEQIFQDINGYIFKTEGVDLNHMDLNEVYFCTSLRGVNSSFLPFNIGMPKSPDKPYSIGKGNPHIENGINVSYMWEQIWTKEKIILLIERFIFIEKKKDRVLGTLVIRTSDELNASQQKTLEGSIINALTNGA